jgi:L-alanine-DL-glutamate epimerase-like enolase superfamily enzyme
MQVLPVLANSEGQMTIERIEVRRLDLSLIRPYKVSFTTFSKFQPLVAEVVDSNGVAGFGEAEITPGYSSETSEGAWSLLGQLIEQVVGLAPAAARAALEPHIAANPSATSVLYAAVEMLEGNPILAPEADTRVPLLQPVHSFDLDAIPDEVEEILAEGFRTLKIKVGFDVEADLRRVAKIQEVVAGRVTLRLDANHSYTRDQGRAFGAALDPEGIELFEQPCANDDWAGNTAVAAVSRVPVMLDESIYGTADIDRAAAIEGVGFVKLKLKKIGGLDLLLSALGRIRSLGMTPVLGDGTATEIGCWQEACVARLAIDNAGEMNGFLKFRDRLFADPLQVADGASVLPAGSRPTLDSAVVKRVTVAEAAARAGSRFRAAE